MLCPIHRVGKRKTSTSSELLSLPASLVHDHESTLARMADLTYVYERIFLGSMITASLYVRFTNT
eukprot:5871288-Pleurochrysis_carterae.AAC.2